MDALILILKFIPNRAIASHLPDGGLAAARTDVLDFSMVVIPALAMDMVCCSMACMGQGKR